MSKTAVKKTAPKGGQGRAPLPRGTGAVPVPRARDRWGAAGSASPEPVQQIRLALIEGAPFAPSRGVAHRVIGVAVPASRVAGLGVDRPVATFDALRDQVVDEGVLPGRVRAGCQVAVTVPVTNARLAERPVEIAAELADHHGVALVLEIAEVLLPTTALQRCVDHEVALRVTGGVAFEARALGLRRVH